MKFAFYEFPEVRGYKVSPIAARIRLEVFAGGTFTARNVQDRYSRYGEKWQAGTGSHKRTSREFLANRRSTAPWILKGEAVVERI